ncbi:MAG: hypothetical protein Q4D41_01815 [Prevotellaceae bacterium]|nr:hypothetical protein [Prevotellaceae bacterium]
MKKIIYKSLFILSSVLTFGSLDASSQNVTVYLNDGTSVQYPSEQVDSVVFSPAEENQPEAVDLGLSVLWASYNVGATNPQESGDFFAWGETETKDSYNSSTYFDPEYTYWELTNDTCFSGKPEYDAATCIWGSEWRTPTVAEYIELITMCTWKSTRIRGINGYRVTGVNGNSIFLPAAGNAYDSSVYGAQDMGFYWTSECTTEFYEAAYYFKFGSGSDYECTMGYKNNGHVVRPVKNINN